MDKTVERNVGIDVEISAKSNKIKGSIGELSGYAIKFNKPSVVEAPFTEYIMSTALDHVDISKVLILYDHNYANVLGRVDAGTLELKVDDTGLKFKVQVPDTSLGRDVYANVKAGNLKGMSFGFTVAKGGDSWKQTSPKPTRFINQIKKVNEISIVSLPAYDDTSVNVTRDFDAFKHYKEQNYRQKVKYYLDHI